MAASSGKKYFPSKVRDVLPEYFDFDGTNTAPHSMGKSRSVGKKYFPVRIPTGNFDARTGSGRKTMGLSSRKPIRNLHKMFESPKRTARKRLDNLYDCSKPKMNLNTTIVMTQAPSAKKLAPKTPVTSHKKLAPKTPVTSHKKPDRKNEPIKQGQNSRKSRLLQPGTISGSFINARKSLAPRTSICKLMNNQPTLAPKNLLNNRPSDVVEESPQPLELSYVSSDEVKKLPLLNYTLNKLIDEPEKNDNRTSTSTNSQYDKERPTHCCKCSGINNGSSPSEHPAKSADMGMKVLLNSKEIHVEDLICDKNENEGGLQRPTVIVMQKETAPEITTKNLDKTIPVSVQEGSYSEILGFQPSANSSVVDESLIFKHTENACTRSENTDVVNVNVTASKSINELIDTHKETLVEQQRFLTDTISQYENCLRNAKLMLENVNARLDKFKILESNIKSKVVGILTIEESSLPAENNFKTSTTTQGSSDTCESSFKEDAESGVKKNRSKERKQRKNRKSINVESRVNGGETDSRKDVLTERKPDDNKIENNENEPPKRRRSARLAIKNGDLSLPVEPSTPKNGNMGSKITQAKSKPCSPSMSTPALTAKWGRRSARPLREYMVLKSAIKFLNTPDSRRYRIGSDERVEILDSMDNNDQARVSDKLLKELHDLYATP